MSSSVCMVDRPSRRLARGRTARALFQQAHLMPARAISSAAGSIDGRQLTSRSKPGLLRGFDHIGQRRVFTDLISQSNHSSFERRGDVAHRIRLAIERSRANDEGTLIAEEPQYVGKGMFGTNVVKDPFMTCEAVSITPVIDLIAHTCSCRCPD